MPAKRAAFDEEAFLVDAVSGAYAQQELGRRHGISESLAGKIMRGQRRRALSDRIRYLRSSAAIGCQELLYRMATNATDLLNQALGLGPSRLGLMAVRIILDRMLGRVTRYDPLRELTSLDCDRITPAEAARYGLSRMTLAEGNGEEDETATENGQAGQDAGSPVELPACGRQAGAGNAADACAERTSTQSTQSTLAAACAERTAKAADPSRDLPGRQASREGADDPARLYGTPGEGEEAEDAQVPAVEEVTNLAGSVNVRRMPQKVHTSAHSGPPSVTSN